MLSDVGANSFLLCDETFLHSRRSVNRLSLLVDFVRGGGGLLMVGGYMSFTGIDGRARFGMSPLADVLPVQMLDHDDRVEVPEGVLADVLAPEHDLIAGTSGPWPRCWATTACGPSRTPPSSSGRRRPVAHLRAGGGRPHRRVRLRLRPALGAAEFVEWPDYPRLWTAIVGWLAGDRGHDVSAREAVTKVQL